MKEPSAGEREPSAGERARPSVALEFPLRENSPPREREGAPLAGFSLKSGALSSAQAAGTLLDRHVFEHYRTVLGDIEERGFYPTLATASRPYAEAVWRNFAADRPTLTEEFLATGGVRRTWRRARDWIRTRGRSLSTTRPE